MEFLRLAARSSGDIILRGCYRNWGSSEVYTVHVDIACCGLERGCNLWNNLCYCVTQCNRILIIFGEC